MDVRPMTRLDAFRALDRAALPRDCEGFVASLGGVDCLTAFVTPHARGDGWVVVARYDGKGRSAANQARTLVGKFVAGLTSRKLAPLWALADAGVPAEWLERVGFEPAGDGALVHKGA